MGNGVKNTVGKPRGKPFAKGGDPRLCKHPPGRPTTIKCIPDLLRWAGGLIVPDKAIKQVREFFDLPNSIIVNVDQACILRSRMEAINGDAKHLDFWASRTEGKITDKLELSGGTKLEIMEEIVDAAADKPAT